MKDSLTADVDRRADLLFDVSHRIHGRPELNFEEFFAHELLTDVLRQEGFRQHRK